MKLPNIEKYSYSYAIFKVYLQLVHDWIFYKRFYRSGLNNLPKDEPVLLVPNHQNTLMDASVVIFSKISWQPNFLARSDVFKSLFLRKLLFFLKVLPIYRIRDGKEEVMKNKLVFKKTIEILEAKKFLTIYPEASHVGKRKLRTIHKGVSRLYFDTEKKNNFELGIKIIPVGVYYSNYFSLRSLLQINYGKPIDTTGLKELYQEHENKAHRELRKRISKAMSKEMIDIQHDEYYDMYENMREIYDKPMMKKMNAKNFKQPQKFKADKETINKLDEYYKSNPVGIKNLNDKVTEYANNLKKFKLRDWVVEHKKSWLVLFLQVILLTITFPIFLFGFLNNIILAKLPKLITRKIKDRNFHSSIEWGIYVFISPIYYFLIFCVVWIFTDPFYIKWIYLILLPISAIFAQEYWVKSIKIISKLKYYFGYNTEKYKILRKLRTEIINIMEEVSKK